VFAAWIANKKLPETFIKAFNEANSYGLQHLEDVIEENPFSVFDLRKYYTECIKYKLDDRKRAGLELFLEKLNGKTHFI
jgi:chorismate dehydratase